MKKTLIILVLILALLFSVTGCAEQASQTLEQGKTTVEYLQGEFAEKLEEQGADVYSGKITNAEFKAGSTGQITFVETKDGKDGEPKDVPLDKKVQVVYVTNSSPDGNIMDGEEFIKAFVPGNNDNFKVFTLEDKAVLILSVEL